MTVEQDVYSQPYLESYCQQSGNHSHSCLKEECLEAGSRCDMGGYQHNHQNQVWHFFRISDSYLCSVRTYDGREYAEEHRKDECGRDAEV